MAITEVTDEDLATIERQLGRSPRGVIGVAARCSCSNPLVVATKPRLEDGTPFPTFFYLTSPELVLLCSRLEAAGKMREYQDRLGQCQDWAEQYVAAHRHYLQQRENYGEVLEIAAVSAGGMPTRVKCLHALVAHALAAGPGVNPVGDAVLDQLQADGVWSRTVCHCESPAF